MTDTLTFTRTLSATPAQVYFALTDRNALIQWLCNTARLRPRVGGYYFWRWTQGYFTAGEFTAVEANEKLAFTWQGKGEPGSTNVTIELSGDEDGPTTLTLAHSDIGDGDAWADTRRELEIGWNTGLDNLKSILETGLDKRLYDPPILGVFPAGLVSAEQAAENGWDVEGGVRINGTVPSSGAESAGLLGGDVIISINNQPTTGFQTMGPAIAGKKAGDEVEVVYYRDNAKQSVNMPLTPRPVPQTPASHDEFISQLRDIYAQQDQQLDEILAGVSDETAYTAPEEGAWSAVDVLGHMLLVERSVQGNLALQLTGGTIDGFPNQTVMLESFRQAYPTLADYVAAWKNAEAETISLVANLPDEFIARKYDYMNLANNLLNGLPGHTGGHIQQIKQTLESVQN